VQPEFGSQANASSSAKPEFTNSPSSPSVQPTVSPTDQTNTETSNSTIDLDDLTARFEALKKKTQKN